MGETSRQIYTSASLLRHRQIHREPLNMFDLRRALQLPALLGDYPRAAEINRVYTLVCENTAVDADISKELKRLLFEEKPIVTLADLTAKMQDLLEESAFRKAERDENGLLVENGWTVYEQVELNM